MPLCSFYTIGKVLFWLVNKLINTVGVSLLLAFRLAKPPFLESFFSFIYFTSPKIRATIHERTNCQSRPICSSIFRAYHACIDLLAVTLLSTQCTFPYRRCFSTLNLGSGYKMIEYFLCHFIVLGFSFNKFNTLFLIKCSSSAF